MNDDVMFWVFVCGIVALFFAWMITYEVSRSLDDGWLGDFVEKRRQKEPPFPLDKPNSCEYCEHIYSHEPVGNTYYCDVNHFRMNKCILVADIYKRDIIFRTWDKCDYYVPRKVCKTCRYRPSPNEMEEIHIVGDEEVRIMVRSESKCPYGSECKHAEKWEPKEDE